MHRERSGASTAAIRRRPSTARPGERATLFLLNPSGNALELKDFADIQRQLFSR